MRVGRVADEQPALAGQPLVQRLAPPEAQRSPLLRRLDQPVVAGAAAVDAVDLVALGVAEDEEVVPDMLEREEFASRPARIKNYEKVIAFLAPIFKSQTRQYWDDRLTELEVPHSAILNSKEVLEGELGQYHGVMAECEGPRGKFRTIRSPLHFDGEIEREITAPPELGQDNAEYLEASRTSE
jgi:crotonobetainyl-CoA:carnitine CoA-transferase CaiB-like acyl-CoA transferase